MARVLVISFSNLARDPRVDRQIGFLRKRHRIIAAGLAPPRHPVDEFIDISSPPRRKRGQALGLALLLARRYDASCWGYPATIAAFERVQDVRPDVVLANDLWTLPIALRLGAPVVFDAHEHAPTTSAELWAWRALMAPRIRWLCRHYIPQVAVMTTVSEGLADTYAHETGVRARVVTNAPHHHDLLPTDVHSPVRLLHHGAAQRGRGLKEMIRLVELLDERFIVDFVLVEGSSGYRDNLIRVAQGEPRILFPNPWPMDGIVRMANAYDIGLFLLPPLSPQKLHTLPNKFFEFIQARLAVAIGPSPEMARIVRQYGCGIVADDFAPETLAARLNALTFEEIADFKAASDLAAGDLCAEKNEEDIVGAVEDALRQAR